MSLNPLSYINIAPLLTCFSKTYTAIIGANLKISSDSLSEEGCKLKTAFFEEESEFLTKFKIKENVYFLISSNNNLLFAQGTNGPKGDALLVISPSMADVEWDGVRGLLKHEFTHIVNNDCVTIPTIGAIAAFTCAFFPVSSTLTSIGLAIGAPLIAENIYQFFCEIRADNNAIAHSTNEELMGMRRILKAQSNIDKEFLALKNVWSRLYTQAFLLTAFCYSLYPLSTRIKKIEKELMSRGHAAINDMEETSQIAKIEVVLRENHILLEEFYKKNNFMSAFKASYEANKKATELALKKA